MLAFESTDVREWEEHLHAYSSRLEALGSTKLGELDQYYRVELPHLLESRESPHLKKEELVKLVDWKLTRGKWRPRLLSYASGASETEVEETTAAAFSLLPNLKPAIERLCKLKGIGPATASAILAIHSPAVAPFMSDEAMAAALKGSKEYTVKRYLEFAERLQEKAEELKQHAAGDGSYSFTASDVERALWSSAAASMPRRQSAGEKKKSSPNIKEPDGKKKARK